MFSHNARVTRIMRNFVASNLFRADRVCTKIY